jgi:uncharacterized membrane protein YcjF (UPF0283 family)
LSRAPPRNEEDHTHEAAYNTAIEQLNSQPKQWHPPGGTAEETIAICTTDNSQAVQDLQKQWDGKRWLVLVGCVSDVVVVVVVVVVVLFFVGQIVN